MKAALLPLSAGLAMAALAPLSAGVRDLERDWISPDAQLVVHFDFALFQRSTVWKLLQENSDDMDLEDLDEIRDELGIDPFTDLISLSAYSSTSDPDDGVALLVGSANIDQALVRLQEKAEYGQVEVEGLTLHVWREHGNDEAAAYVQSLPDGNRLVVLSDSREHTARAARIVRGEAPSHLDAGGALPITPSPGSFFYLATAAIPGMDDLPPASKLAGLTKDIHVDVGETDGFLNVQVSAVAGSPEDALQASKMIEGFKALGYFAGQELGIASLLDAVRVDTRGNQILIGFRYDVEALVDEVKTIQEDHGPF